MLPKQERPKKVLLKGIHPETKIEDIKIHLSKNFKIHRISQLKNFKTKTPMPLFLVNLIPTPNLRFGIL